MKKRYLILPILTLFLTSNVYAITSNDVTYDNDGTTEILTDSMDNLYSELKKYKTTGSVAANQMLEGATGYSKGELVTGTIKSKGATTYTPGTSNQTIAAGQYLSGAQTIKGDANLVAGNIKSGVSIFGVSGTYTSDADATAGNILSGKTAYVNGSKVTGTIASKAATTYTPGTSNQTIAAGQYLSGAQTIAGDADLKASNILNGVDIFGVTGTHVASNHSTSVFWGSTASISGSGSPWQGETLMTRDGIVSIFISVDNGQGLVPDGWNYAIKKNGVILQPDYAGRWDGTNNQGVAYYKFNVSSGDKLSFNMSMSGIPSSDRYWLSIFGILFF